MKRPPRPIRTRQGGRGTYLHCPREWRTGASPPKIAASPVRLRAA